MAFFADLSPLTYSPTCGLEIVNVGWLDDGHSFPVGATTLEFHAALRALCADPVYLHCGDHACWFCRSVNRNVEGNRQIRVQGATGIWYAAPTMVHHYVTHHGYLPPLEFVQAVLAAGSSS